MGVCLILCDYPRLIYPYPFQFSLRLSLTIHLFIGYSTTTYTTTPQPYKTEPFYHSSYYMQPPPYPAVFLYMIFVIFHSVGFIVIRS